MTDFASQIGETLRTIAREGAIVLGGGKQAELLFDLLEWSGGDCRRLRIFDDRAEAGPRGLAIEGDLFDGLYRAARDGAPALVALGSKQAALRDCLFEALADASADCPSIFHPSTLIAPSATIEQGVTIFPGCTIGPRTFLGRGATLCQGVVLEHDTRVERNAWIGPRAATSGFVAIGEHSFIGAGAVLTREAKIGPRTLVGAGSLVLHDLPGDSLAFGSPAQLQGPLRPGMDAPLASDWERHRPRFDTSKIHPYRILVPGTCPC